LSVEVALLGGDAVLQDGDGGKACTSTRTTPSRSWVINAAAAPVVCFTALVISSDTTNTTSSTLGHPPLADGVVTSRRAGPIPDKD
jgi:hypothetical protein